MKLIRQVLLLALFSCLLAANAPAHNALFTITPTENQAGGIFFKITSEPLPDGGAKFRVVITENQAKFNAHPLAELGLLKSTKSARSIDAGRKLPLAHDGQSLVCTFTVSQKELADPNFCFFFSNLENALEDKFLFALSKDFVFARLNEFAPHRRH